MDRYQLMQKILQRNAYERERLKKHPELRFLFFEVTSRCNLSCLHCGSNCLKQTGTDLPTDYMKKTLDTVQAHCGGHLPMLCITGGEPLLYPHLTQMMRDAADRGFLWGMTTNATLIDENKARELYDAGLASVMVSVDGLRESHDRFRNTPGSYDLAQRGIKALLKQAPEHARVDVITVVNKHNLSELEALYRQFVGSEIRSWRVVNMEPIGRALQNADFMLQAEDYQTLFAFIKEKHFTCNEMEVSYGCSHYLTLAYERMLRPYPFTCMAGLQVASIACNGDILACLDIERRKELVQGNVASDDFWQVWCEKFAFFRSDRTALNEKCAACPDRTYCAGDSAHTWDYAQNKPMLCFKELLCDAGNGG